MERLCVHPSRILLHCDVQLYSGTVIAVEVILMIAEA